MTWHFRFGFVFGDHRSNLLMGSNWSDFIFGFGGDDEIYGRGGNDTIFAGRGNDWIDGGAGNDFIDGGRGFDTAAFDGSIFDYDVNLCRGWFSTTAIVTRFGDTGRPVEVDYLRNVEALHFAEENYTLYLDGRNNKVLALDDAAATDEDTSLTLSFDDLLANDTDFDGDTLTITRVDALSSLGALISVVDGTVMYSPAGVFDTLKEGETVADTFTYTVDDGRGGSTTATVSVTVTGTNDAPDLELASEVDFAENGTDVVALAAASDVDSDGISFSLSGDDAGLFTIDEATGEIRFRDAPDFEAPADLDGDNAYDLIVTATDTEGATDSQDLTVTVTDVVEIPDVDARINEFHYDNAGTDTGEFVEIRTAAGDDISFLQIGLINGSNGSEYNRVDVSSLTMTTDGTYDYYVWDLPANGLQNGAPDGIALVNGGSVLEFLSYEGEIETVIDGQTVTSTDVGVAENGGTETGHSLQRNEDGTWNEAAAATKGAANEAPGVELNARINEFHYDNAGSDTGEFVEIRVNAGADVSALDVRLINGNGGAEYNLAAVSGLTMTTDGTYDYYVWDLPSNGIQNGAPDGIALVNDGEVVEFLSYEGEITTTIAGVEVTSTDVGVAEDSGTAAGDSLQRNDDGSWSEAAPETKGAENGGGTGPLTEARINELHYDNDGNDTGEFVEIRVNADADVSGLQVQLINGNGGASYNSADLSTLTMTTDGSYDYYVWDLPANGIQNGAPDGVALVNGTGVVEFLTYEGTITTTIAGTEVTSTDIGVSESNSTPVGQSLQRSDDGSWNDPATETKGAANDGGGGGGEPTARFISEIQGTGSASLLVGDYVLVSAVVTYTTGNGFFLQEEDADADGDALTSEGIFVFTGGAPTVVVGDVVDVAGTVEEFFGMTQLGSAEITKTGSTTLPTAASIQLSKAATNYEQYEGMRISVTSGIENERVTIIENFNFDRFGDITVSAGAQTQATQLYDAQTQADEIAAHIEGNMNNRLVITDGTSSQNPDSYSYVANTTAGDDGDGILSAGDDFTVDGPTLRLGAEMNSAIEGVLTYEFGEFKVLVDGTLDIDEATNSGARQDMPDDVGGEIQVASFNVLNYFTTFSGGTGPNGDLNPRGADNQAEFDRQTAKIVEAMVRTEAEVFALQEIENNGFGEASAIATLVDALNAKALADGTGAVYDYANPLGGDGFLGTDAIMTGMVYDTTKLTLVHAEALVFEEASAADTYAIAEFLNTYVSSSDRVGDFQRNRPATIATFEDANGEVFTIVSNHFKSKGDSNLQDLADGVQAALDGGSVPAGEVAAVQAALDALIADPNFDQGNGQGFWNQVRADAASELAAYLDGAYADTLAGLGKADADYLLMGDFNAYAEEDPVQAVRDGAGYTDLIDQFLGQEDAYSYVFDGQQGTLDQALASGSLAGQVTGLTEWHINADEPDLLNYDQDFNNPDFYNDDPFAASDHDPVIVGLDLGPQSDALLA
ncbi:ExeM/NucH family extracellular endonuclease [Roseibium sediminicola]|uniref:ExeM/NucH family extracellular endonuclease n=1 Tax=Roseibium sediminicola TaxID=2933272 RepID=A0ABT0GWF2_9HYPH|nr:ExeM/NucH family extracellular endonuclease [Roseibium sp. CAU 1639]MCK7613775.1 ExeM/NucH family extracellular endonuclease [Roseibium sp. CAU 1639]